MVACQEKHNWSCNLQIYGEILSKHFLNKVAELEHFQTVVSVFFSFKGRENESVFLRNDK